ARSAAAAARRRTAPGPSGRRRTSRSASGSGSSSAPFAPPPRRAPPGARPGRSPAASGPTGTPGSGTGPPPPSVAWPAFRNVGTVWRRDARERFGNIEQLVEWFVPSRWSPTMIRKSGAGEQAATPGLVLESNDGPVHAAAVRAHRERTRRNSDWLSAHWGELLPAARGRHVAVAGQQAFVADTPEEAWAMARAAHP